MSPRYVLSVRETWDCQYVVTAPALADFEAVAR